MFIIKESDKDLITKVCKGAKPRSTIQAFENLLIEAGDKVRITAGDGQVEFIGVLGDAELAGSVSVNADKFLKAVSACSFYCKVYLKDDSLEIRSGRRKFKLSTIDPNSYPSLDSHHKESDKLDISANEFLDNVKSLSHIAAVDDVRYYLNGVYIGKDFAATNGHRLATVKADLPCDAIIPVESIKKFPSDIDGVVYISSSSLVIESDNLILKSKLIDGSYPNYMAVAGTPSKTVDVDPSEFVSAIKDALITSDDKGSVSIEFTENELTVVSSAVKSESKITIPCKSSGSFNMAFNGKYLIDALSFYDSSVLLGFSDTQMIVNGDVNNVVMQVKL